MHAAGAGLEGQAFTRARDAEAGRIEQDIRRAKGPVWGFLLQGHGLYAWGRSTPEALRHLDAFDYLFALSLKLKGIPA